MGDEEQQNAPRRNPERRARAPQPAPQPEEPEGGEEPPVPEPTAEEVEAARQERLRQDAQALADAEEADERLREESHLAEIARLQSELDALRAQTPAERRNEDRGIALIGTAVTTMTSILRENTNISKKQLDFLELLNADAAADAMLKETQLTDPTNPTW